MLIVSFSFGFGGMLLIQYSYQASIKQEKRAARNSYEMILRMLKEINEMDDTYQNQTFASVLKRLNWQGLLRDSSVRLLKEQHGEVQWKQPLYYNRKNDNFRRSNGFSTKQGKAVVFQNKNKVYYQITSKISYGKETMVFQGAYDISEVYATRHQQLVSFRKIFVLVIGIEIVVSYFLAMILTRPLQKLSQVSKQIADGDYSVRVPVHTEDEIGELSVSFNYMTEQLIEKLMKLDQLLKNQEEFMGSFAHEMKTPLTSIIGYADLMRMEALSKEEQKEACGYIYSEGKRLQNLSLKLMKLLVLKNQQFQMKKQIRNALLVVAALLLVVLFYFLPNIQAALVDKKTFGQSEDLSLNPVEISVEATQTTLEKLKIINNHILSVAVRPSSRTVDGRDVEKTAKKQTNLLLKK